MSVVYYARTVIGCYVDKSELWTEIDTGKVACKQYKHEILSPSRFCPSCGNPTFSIIERRPTALFSLLTEEDEVDIRNDDEFSDWWAGQGHNSIMDVGIGNMSPVASSNTKDDFLVLGILIGLQSENRGGREVSLSELRDAADKMSAISHKYLGDRAVKVYTSLYCSY